MPLLEVSTCLPASVSTRAHSYTVNPIFIHVPTIFRFGDGLRGLFTSFFIERLAATSNEMRVVWHEDIGNLLHQWVAVVNQYEQ